MKSKFVIPSVLKPVLGLVLGLLVASFLAFLFKENPIHVLKILSTSFAQSKYDLGLTLFYTTCFIFSGLAFAIPMKAGLFHIGAEGQLVVSALIAAVLGNLITLNSFAGTFLIIIGTISGAILAALLIAWYKHYRNGHEVVVAIMFNFIFSALAAYITLNFFQNPVSQNPETALVHENFQFLKNDLLKVYFDQSPVSVFFILSLISCIGLYFFEKKHSFFDIVKAYGQNPVASERAGYSQIKILSYTMALAGLFSGLLGLTEVLGNTFQYKIGFSPQYGFLGIAVALLARHHFLGIIGSGLLLAVLHKGASDLDLETQFLTRDFSKVIQALIIFSVAASFYLFSKRKKDS